MVSAFTLFMVCPIRIWSLICFIMENVHRQPPLHVDAVLSARGLSVDVWGCCLDDDPPAVWRRQEKATNGRAEHSGVPYLTRNGVICHFYTSTVAAGRTAAHDQFSWKPCYTSHKEWGRPGHQGHLGYQQKINKPFFHVNIICIPAL